MILIVGNHVIDCTEYRAERGEQKHMSGQCYKILQHTSNNTDLRQLRLSFLKIALRMFYFFPIRWDGVLL